MFPFCGHISYTYIHGSDFKKLRACIWCPWNHGSCPENSSNRYFCWALATYLASPLRALHPFFFSFKFTPQLTEAGIIIFSILWWKGVSRRLRNCPKSHSQWWARIDSHPGLPVDRYFQEVFSFLRQLSIGLCSIDHSPVEKKKRPQSIAKISD